MTPWRVPYPKFGSAPALPRVTAIAERLGINLASFGQDGVVIVGSNGKGSTAAMTAALLQQTGAGVGLFTSPHLWRLNERFRFDGVDIDDDELGHHWRRVQAVADAYGAERGEQVGAFEFLFLIAANWFAARGARHTVWEAGIGGRLDPVRLIEARRIALTSLDLEHTELLGDALEDIACDKLDAAPRGAKAFVSASCEPQRGVIETHCAARGVNAVFVEDSALSALPPPLAGAHQRSNAALALALADDVAGLSTKQKRAGLAATRWPARLEVIGRDPLIVIDACHTPGAAALAHAGFTELAGAGPATLVCGVSVGKEAAGTVAALASGFARIICVSASHKGADPELIAALAREANPGAVVEIAPSLAEARKVALAGSAQVLVAGGLFLAAEFRALHFGVDGSDLGHL
jgi:dihydrofolate synthase/folylpolyglutamate synthase